jgi:endonuclease YncB( thermonuclease family)
MRVVPRSGAPALCCAVVALTAAAVPARAESRREGELLSGPAVVAAAHTLILAGERLRLWGIDAPERGSWCFRNGRRWKPAAEAMAALAACLGANTVTCRIHRRERHWFQVSYVSECWMQDGRDVGDCLVAGGWATDYTCYSDGYYRDRETEAQHKGVGLWACDNGAPTRRWGRRGQGVACEAPAYSPTGPSPR